MHVYFLVEGKNFPSKEKKNAERKNDRSSTQLDYLRLYSYCRQENEQHRSIVYFFFDIRRMFKRKKKKYINHFHYLF